MLPIERLLGNRLRLLWLTAPALVVCTAADAATGLAPYAAPGAQSLPGPAGGAVRVVLALLVVLAAVVGAGWLSRRVHGTGAGRSGSLQVLSQLPLGPRERAVLLRVGTEQVLVGVANGSVRTLHVLTAASAEAGTAAPAASATDPVVRPGFRAILLKSLGK